MKITKRCLIIILFLFSNMLHATDPSLQTVAVSQNNDGRLEIFYIRSGNLYHRWQISPAGKWSEEYLFYEPAKGVAVEQNLEGCLNVFIVRQDSSMILIQQSAPSNGWDESVELGDQAKAISLIKDSCDTLHLFYTNLENKLYHQWQLLPEKNWSTKTVLASYAGAISAGLNQDGRLEVFYVGTGDTLFHKWQNALDGTWSEQTPFAGTAKQIAVSQNRDGRLEVFFIGLDDILYHKWQIEPSNGWDNDALFADYARFVTVGQNMDGRMEVLYTVENDILHHRCQIAADSAWYPEEQFGWTAKGTAITSNIDSRLEAFYLDANGILFHNWQLQPGLYWAGEYPFIPTDQTLFTVNDFPDDPVYTPSPGNWHVNDHCFIQGPDTRWHMFGIVWPDPGSGDLTIANYFGHATTDSLEQTVWEEEAPPFYESLDGGKVLWAPHVILHENTYYMFYCNGGEMDSYAIILRTSTDLVTWSESHLLFTDGFQGRDPMVRWCTEENEWIMYYTATDDPSGGNFVVACRTSDDLINWSDRKIVYSDYHRGTGYGPTESPFVVQRGEYYYLFLGPRPYDDPTDELPNWEHPGYVGTDVFRSDRRDLWTNADYVDHIAAHAPEIIQDENGDWYISHAGILQGGLYLTGMTWLDGLTAVQERESNRISKYNRFRLIQNYPNPFNLSTKIKYESTQSGHVLLKIYNITGQEIETLVNEFQQAGLHEITWQAKGLPSGLYFYKIQAGDPLTNSGRCFSETRKFILQK